MSLTLGTPVTFFTATAAGATLAKTLWPSTYTVTLPNRLSGAMANIVSSSAVIGGVLAAQPGVNALMLDFAGVGSADLTLVVEIGKLNVDGAIGIPIASVSLKSITTSGTLADVNPFTAAAATGTTYRFFDLATLTNYGDFNQVSVNVGGSENNLPSQLLLTMEEGVWYYFIVTSLGSLTSALCVITPTTARAERIGSVPVLGNAYTSRPTVTRPANTTPYTAGDVVGGAITFTTAGPSDGHVLITSADLEIDVSAIPSGMTTFRLYLYDVTPPSALSDNDPWDLPSGDRSAFLGYIDLGTPVDLGSTLYVQTDNINRKLKLNGSTSLFAYLTTAGGFTPAGNSEVYRPRIVGLGV